MAQSFNKVILIGRLTKDPESREISSDKRVATFSMAVDGYGEKVNFFDCEAWGQPGEYIYEFLKKGSQLVIDGELVQQTWEKDGQKHSRVIVRVSKAQSLSSVPKQQDKITGPATVRVNNVSEIPF